MEFTVVGAESYGIFAPITYDHSTMALCYSLGTMNHSKEQVAVVMAVLQRTPLTLLRNQRTVRTLCGTEAAPGTIVCTKEAIV